MTTQTSPALRAELDAARAALQQARARLALLEGGVDAPPDPSPPVPQSEEVLRALANSFPQPAWMASAEGKVGWYNQRWYEYTGLAEDPAVTDGWHAVVDPSVLPAVQQHWANAL